ncbi:MAG: amino acid adenylation domain-containing protein [Deltaproteobacteria bacterium]|nr:amino acid adenylation domain-containing protein [Deltaproteobacteria bacterium]
MSASNDRRAPPAPRARIEIESGLFLQRFEAVARAHPGRPAVAWRGEGVLTYADLSRDAAAFAGGLQAAGVRRGDRVGLCLERSMDTVIALLGTWVAGASFVPLDPRQPLERLRWIAEDADLRALVTDPSARSRLAGLGPRITTRPSLIASCAIAEPRGASPEQEAYVCYTSGTTGRPKGVQIAHRGLTAFLDAQIEAFRLAPDSRSLLFAAATFDASISEIGAPLLAGACVVIEPETALTAPDLFRQIAQRQVTHVNLPPALLARLDPEHAPGCITTVIIGGEVPPPAAVRAWARRVKLVSVYGPTEATVCTTLARCTPDWARALIGAPIPGVSLTIRDEEGRPVGRGRPGELWISGPGLALGYLGLPELTRARFPVIEGTRWYRSGDRVVEHPDGEIEFLGRVDRQIKLRGLRIEVEEIERNLLDHPAVGQAHVRLRPLGVDAHPALVAFVAAGEGSRDPTLEQTLRAHLALRLPVWMLPERVVALAELPLGAHGKVASEALDAWPLTHPAEGRSRASDQASDREAKLLEIWTQVLGHAAMDPADDFFALGGDSFAAVEIAAAAERAGLPVAPSQVLRHPSVRELSRALGDTPERLGECAEAAALEREITFDEALTAALARPRREPARAGGVFLTGATGFLGSRLLLEVLDTTGAPVRCLVRAPDRGAARARLEESLLQHGAAARLGAAVEIVLGDLALPRFGLEATAWSSLVEQVALIHHAAAQVNLVHPYARLAAANVGGTREIIRLAAESGARLHAVSTLSVFVATDRNHGHARESDTLEETRFVYGGYAQTKWTAERMLHRARAQGLARLLVTRPGLITGDSRTGRGGKTDFLRLFIRGLARIGAVPAGASLALDVTPVDFAARAMALLGRADLRPPAIFHLANPEPLMLERLVDAMSARGVALRRLPLEGWRRRVEGSARLEDAESAAAYLALCRTFTPEDFSRLRSLDLFQATGITFNTTEADRALAAAGLCCPPPSAELIDRYVAEALGR